jgi:hypothetical protein
MAATRVTLVALVDLPTFHKAKGEVFVASGPAAAVLIKNRQARAFPTADPHHYTTRMLTPDPDEVAPAPKSRKGTP